MIDRPGREKPRFPPTAEGRVTLAVRRQLDGWSLDRRSLLVTGGACGTDIIAAEQALELGSTVWLLLARPLSEFVATSVHVDGTDWADRFAAVRDRSVVRVQDEEHEPLRGDDVYERTNDWLLDVAVSHAPAHRLRVLVVWDGEAPDGPGGTADFLERAKTLDADIAVLDPA
jgi:hypothetical protein